MKKQTVVDLLNSEAKYQQYLHTKTPEYQQQLQQVKNQQAIQRIQNSVKIQTHFPLWSKRLCECGKEF